MGLDADPTPGDPVLVLSGGQEYLAVADSIDNAAAAMSRLDVDGTVSQAVDALMDTKEDTIAEIRKAYSRYVATGEALMGYASSLERVQSETLAALEQARAARDEADAASGSRDRWQELADGAKDEAEKAEYQRQADEAGGDAEQAASTISSAQGTIETAVSDRDRAAEHAIDRIEEITSSGGLNDGWWDNWGSKLVAAIADIADMISTIAGILAIIVAFIPVVGTALAGVLIVIAAVAAIVSAVANITLAATGERSWADAGIAIAGAALSVIGLGAAAKAATGLAKGIAKSGGFRQALKKGWCKFGFGKCFTAGTSIRTVDGTKAIEDIVVGDKVWTRNLETGADELQVVEETFVRTTTELFHLTINGTAVSTTAEHPFMVQSRGWLDAAFLKVGDLLVTETGTATVDAIQTEQRDDADAVTVYNFHAATNHNYYVYAGETPILVHNAAHVPEGAVYKVDELGRPSGIEAKLTEKTIGGKTKPDVDDPPGYDPNVHQKGHLHGAQLGGSNTHPANFVSQFKRANSPWQRAIEGEVRKVVESGEDVMYKVTPHYSGTADVPHAIHFEGTGTAGYELDFTLMNHENFPKLSESSDLYPKVDGLRFGTRGS
ncbi:polymorphic toxin-type HINT domain-containing protein [Promicromonospora sp. NPDC057138]|uniref:polymorphic toxin-type HINT domain-containing protein n=1 Tax=Promicromonospora sp. NPDC057138 TaxID=3346031 RepID=UPI00363D9D26